MSKPDGKDMDDDDDNQPDFSDLAAQMRQFMGPDGRLDMNKLMGGMREALSRVPGGSDPSGLNWKATATAINRLVGEAGPELTSALMPGDVADSFGLANRWLDEAMAFDGDTLQLELWPRTRWVERTTDQWRSMSAPIVASLGDALVAMATENASEIPELAPLAELMAPMMRTTAGEFFSTRLAKTIADLACSTLSGTDAALPLVPASTVALLPGNIAAFTAGLSAPQTDVTVYLLARECARQRLFAATPWLGPQIMALIEHYARELTIDASVLREGFDVDAMNSMTPARLAEISSQIEDRLFRPAATEEQKAILTRLETLICLVEGWVDHVVAQAAGAWLKTGPALAETLIRRRAVGGPAERALTSLLGITLSSRRVRDAANLWAAVEHDRGIKDRDALWSHPDILPQAEDLDDVMGFVARTSAGAQPDAMDEQLNWLVDQWRKDGEN
ncbi:MAG: zinc-dependent metalloprotease [Propionibacteriaceae bacterium]|nr:zinc-dependent metalloprotease [Propionibacteriaceae bacterium]